MGIRVGDRPRSRAFALTVGATYARHESSIATLGAAKAWDVGNVAKVVGGIESVPSLLLLMLFTAERN